MSISDLRFHQLRWQFVAAPKMTNENGLEMDMFSMSDLSVSPLIFSISHSNIRLSEEESMPVSQNHTGLNELVLIWHKRRRFVG